jgi:hypothetical protein
VIGAAGAVRLATERKDNHTHGTAGCAKDAVIGVGDTISVVYEILRVLQSRLAESRIDIDSDSSTRTGSNKLRLSCIARPSWSTLRLDDLQLWRRSRLPFGLGRFYAVIHSLTPPAELHPDEVGKALP